MWTLSGREDKVCVSTTMVLSNLTVAFFISSIDLALDTFFLFL